MFFAAQITEESVMHAKLLCTDMRDACKRKRSATRVPPNFFGMGALAPGCEASQDHVRARKETQQRAF